MEDNYIDIRSLKELVTDYKEKYRVSPLLPEYRKRFLIAKNIAYTLYNHNKTEDKISTDKNLSVREKDFLCTLIERQCENFAQRLLLSEN